MNASSARLQFASLVPIPKGMKGLIFTEFLEMVADRWSDDVVDEILDATTLASGGAYTSVGTYPHSELVSLVLQLSTVTKAPPQDLVRAFGHHLLGTFLRDHPQFFERAGDAMSLLESVHGHVHVEVRKLYADAELPDFRFVRDGPGEVRFLYRSSRPFADLAHGLIEATVQHYGESWDVARTPATADGTIAFVLTRALVEA